MPKPRVLLFSNWFSPGYRGGGSQSAAINLVRGFKSEFEFLVVTRDRDVGEEIPFADISPGKWTELDDGLIRYLPPRELTCTTINEIVRSTPHDLVHLNSVVSMPFAFYPAFARRMRGANAAPLLISPHGELSPSALAQKRHRKSLYLQGTRTLGIFQKSTWHAANVREAEDIKRTFGPTIDVAIAPPLPQQNFSSQEGTRGPKSTGALRAVFFARIDRMKNLDLAIDFVAAVPNVTLDICGPIGQPDYWLICQTKINESRRPDAFRYIGGIPPEMVARALSKYDLLLLPSQNESFGYAILEALGAGCPVLISDRTPWHGLETAGVGFEVPLGRPDIFEARLMTLRDLDETSHSAMRARGRAYARNYVQTSTANSAMQAIYTNTIARIA